MDASKVGRVKDVRALLRLMAEGGLPWDEQDENALILQTNGQGHIYFIGRENFTADGTQLGTAPLSAEEILARVDAVVDLP